MQQDLIATGSSAASTSLPSSTLFSGGTGTLTSSSATEDIKRLQDYGQGWSQVTDHGKIYLSKKERNVFILEGTKPTGFSACRYSGNPEQRTLVEEGVFTLSCELKCSPTDSSHDFHICLLADILGMSVLQGYDFCLLSLRFDSNELRVENHRMNQAVQTLFVQPGCTLLKINTYVLITMSLDGDRMSLAISGVPVITNLLIQRPRRTPLDANAFSLGLGLYGRSRCYVRLFQIARYASPTPSGEGVGVTVGRDLAAVSDEMVTAAMIERDLVIVHQDRNVRFEDIVGLEDAKTAINAAVLLPLLIPDIVTVKPWKAVILYGPPGAGKTTMAKAVAACTEHVTLFDCSFATLTSKGSGEPEKLLKVLFQTARARAPAILLFDEFDSTLAQRGEANEHEASRRFKAELLVHMDELLNDANTPGRLVLVLAAATTPWELDEDVLRRFEKRIFMPLPDEDTREKIFEISMEGMVIQDDVDPWTLATKTAGYSSSDLQALLRDASMNPLRRKIAGMSLADLVQLRDRGELAPEALPVSLADFEEALGSVRPSVGADDAARYEQWTRDFGPRMDGEP